jgi:hypothetical protein
MIVPEIPKWNEAPGKAEPLALSPRSHRAAGCHITYG